ncbi:MAG: ABC transporter permease [Candidatus Eisenbacteria sp.]|nr:ABC transporter permease [Candidatus Eisenbacteria bacterium]
MTLGEHVRIGLSALGMNRARAGLTMLGVVIGLMAVISLVSFIQGLNRYVGGLFGEMGSRNFVVQKAGIITDLEAYLESMKRKDFTRQDALALRTCRHVRFVAPTLAAMHDIKRGRYRAREAWVTGTTADAGLMGDVEVAVGRYISEVDVEHRRAVCVLGSEVAERILRGEQALGEWIRVGPHRLRIIGVEKERGSILGFSQDNRVVIPITTFEKLFGSRSDLGITVQATGQDEMDKAVDEVTHLLRRRRGVAGDEENDFAILTSDTLVHAWKALSSGALVALVGVGAISLGVAGIGIMNIMLVSVRERTREIGLRKAMGAKRSDILRQFLVESSLLCLMGGLLGVALGITAARVITWRFHFPSAVSVGAIVVGLVVSVGVGLFFGIFPAGRAAKLDPIECLRHE